jgi:hypothetical protein
MDDVVVLEWTYSPPNYFEEPICITHEKYVMTIDSGKVAARIKPENYNKEYKMDDVLHDALNERFLVKQLFTHARYELSKALMYLLHSDGHKDIHLYTVICAHSHINPVDLIIKDKDGNIISDSRWERKEKEKNLLELEERNLLELFEKYRSKDPLIDSLFNSYAKAVSDPHNELIYLYEIRDALKNKFRNEAEARTALGISFNKWRRLRILANTEPLKQGRHRGMNLDVLRDATVEELEEARLVARKLIGGYLEYLEKQDNNQSRVGHCPPLRRRAQRPAPPNLKPGT